MKWNDIFNAAALHPQAPTPALPVGALSRNALRAGEKLRSSTQSDLHGTYFIADNKAVLTFAPRKHSQFVLTLSATGEFFDDGTPSMEAAASYVMEEPVTFYGSFVRRFADFVSSADVERRSR